jgi:hypothetical protein
MTQQHQPTASAYPPQQRPPPPPQQQQLVPLAPGASVQSPWAVNPVPLAPPVHQPFGAGALMVSLFAGDKAGVRKGT